MLILVYFGKNLSPLMSEFTAILVAQEVVSENAIHFLYISVKSYTYRWFERLFLYIAFHFLSHYITLTCVADRAVVNKN